MTKPIDTSAGNVKVRDMTARETSEERMELERLRGELAYRDEQLAQRDRTIHELNREIHRLKDLRRILNSRTGRLAEKEREVSELKRTIARRNQRLSEMEHPAGEVR